MELKRVLIIENDELIGNNVLEEFKTHHVEVKHIRDITELKEELVVPFYYQMIILDWLLEDDSSILAKLCLHEIRHKCFIPVAIWTEELPKFQAEATEVYTSFPEAYIYPFSKHDVRLENLLAKLNEWYDKPPLNLAEIFRKTVTQAIEDALFRLAEHSLDDLVRGLKTLISREQGGEVDIEHVVDVLLRQVSRSVYLDDEFIPQLSQIVSGFQLQHPPANKKEKRIASLIQDLHMYYEPRNDDYLVRTGDIITITFEGNENVIRAIVLTPACDLANPRKTLFLRLVIISKATTTDEKVDQWQLPEDGILYVVNHHEIFALRNQTLASDDNLKGNCSGWCWPSLKDRRHKRRALQSHLQHLQYALS
ncbi:MAG: hypothetical protein HUU38_03015, partial [Anaerolineales bacterium]|nr:hypothetical protein [Anaerolineales bacterium]